MYLAVAILIRYGEAQLLQHLVVLFVIEKRVSDYLEPVESFCWRVLQALANKVETNGGDLELPIESILASVNFRSQLVLA